RLPCGPRRRPGPPPAPCPYRPPHLVTGSEPDPVVRTTLRRGSGNRLPTRRQNPNRRRAGPRRVIDASLCSPRFVLHGESQKRESPPFPAVHGFPALFLFP